jgi:hypothetical protein
VVLDASKVVHINDPLISDLIREQRALPDALMDPLRMDAEHLRSFGHADVYVGHVATFL